MTGEGFAQRMDLALRWDAGMGQFDLVLDTVNADLQAEDTLLTAVLLSLMTDRTAQPDELPAGSDRRGWWADAYATDSDAHGSRLWLLTREKQLPATVASARAYLLEALQWMVDDGLVRRLDAVVFSPRMGWLTAQVQLELDGQSRRYRFMWSDDRQVWHLAGDS